MDSMRSLNKSLPSSQDNRQAPPEQLLQCFRTAALSVTNLYKSAVTGQADARRTGYQDALEDLLKFLDQENLGVQDGEGWRIRQWATQRYDGGGYQNLSETEDEPIEPESRSEAKSPVQIPVRDTSPPPSDTVDGTIESDNSGSDDHQEPSLFQFQGHRAAELDMQTDEASSPPIEDVPSSSAPPTPIRVEVRNRNSRSSARPHNTRSNTRSSQRDFTFTAGTKRKLQFPDFFDISNLPDRFDGSGSGTGSKRGRFV